MRARQTAKTFQLLILRKINYYFSFYKAKSILVVGLRDKSIILHLLQLVIKSLSVDLGLENSEQIAFLYEFICA